MRILALDTGTKRIGVAVSDASKKFLPSLEFTTTIPPCRGAS
jgi:RNase H-fold protein (predicted Holliday junction resolvase)